MTIVEVHPRQAGRRAAPASTTAVFVVLRRMRAPLIVLICSFAVSVFGLTLVPGVDAEGKPWRMDVFDAFYFMSYTASTIGYGEIPQAFSTGQRMWVTISIYLSVIAWAYAIATVFSLVQDRAFRGALSAQRFERVVGRLREPFILVVGFGQAGQVITKTLDAMDHRVVVLDADQEHIDALDLGSYRSDVPGYAADARNPDELSRAGLGLPNCVGVVAVTNDDETNLAVAMTSALLQPDLSVVVSASEHATAQRMREFGTPGIVNPYDLFGDELMLGATAPNTFRLVEWLTTAPGHEPPPTPHMPTSGRWIVCGYGRFGSHLASDLSTHGLDVTVVDPTVREGDGDFHAVTGDATDPTVLAQADLSHAVGFAAATHNDITNLSLVVAARREHPQLFVVARQNQRVNAPLFDALDIDSVLVPARLVAHEVLARISSPLLWRFIQEARRQPDAWAATMMARLTACDDSRRPEMWRTTLDATNAPALHAWLSSEDARLGSLLRDPEDCERQLGIAVLLLVRADTENAADVTILAPDADTKLREGDELLLAGSAADRQALDTTLSVPAAFAYVVTGRQVGNSWVWRRLVNRS